MKNWFVGTTKHQQEIRAATELRDLGFAIYLPKRFFHATVGRRLGVASALRFPGYIFIEFDLAAGEHGPIKNTRGMGELIPPGEFPVPLQSIWKHEMERHIDEEFEVLSGKHKADPRSDLHHGDLVQIDMRDHAANGQQGEYSRTENGFAIVHIGWAVFKLPEIDLKLIEPWDRRKAA